MSLPVRGSLSCEATTPVSMASNPVSRSAMAKQENEVQAILKQLPPDDPDRAFSAVNAMTTALSLATSNYAARLVKEMKMLKTENARLQSANTTLTAEVDGFTSLLDEEKERAVALTAQLEEEKRKAGNYDGLAKSYNKVLGQRDSVNVQLTNLRNEAHETKRNLQGRLGDSQKALKAEQAKSKAIEEKLRAEQEKSRAEEAKTKAAEEKTKAAGEKLRVAEDKLKVAEEKHERTSAIQGRLNQCLANLDTARADRDTARATIAAMIETEKQQKSRKELEVILTHPGRPIEIYVVTGTTTLEEQVKAYAQEYGLDLDSLQVLTADQDDFGRRVVPAEVVLEPLEMTSTGAHYKTYKLEDVWKPQLKRGSDELMAPQAKKKQKVTIHVNPPS